MSRTFGVLLLIVFCLLLFWTVGCMNQCGFVEVMQRLMKTSVRMAQVVVSLITAFVGTLGFLLLSMGNRSQIEK